MAALIAAAGHGTRLGSGPKALLRLGGRSLLELSLAAFAGAVDEVVAAVPAERLGELRAALPGVTLVAGGAHRQDSVAALLGASASALVVIHDVARPFLPAAVRDRVIAAARRHGAASAAVPVADTVVALTAAGEDAPGPGASAVDRDRLRAIQTPQAFDRELLMAAHRAAAAAGVSATDDAGLVRLAGHHVELVTGSRLLFKITEPDDLLIAEALVRWQASRRGAA